jgi:hypothetical protein
VLILPGRLTGAAKRMQEEEGAIEEVAALQVMLPRRKTLLPLFGAVLG